MCKSIPDIPSYLLEYKQGRRYSGKQEEQEAKKIDIVTNLPNQEYSLPSDRKPY
jgi:hypothetical protein